MECDSDSAPQRIIESKVSDMSLWSKARKVFKQLNGGKVEQSPGGYCDHSNVPFKEGTAEFELCIARAELKAGGDLQHGARHLAHLLSLDPSNPEWLKLLEEYLVRVGDDDQFIYPRKEKNYFAEEAVRAFIWARKGQLDEAIDLLLQVVQAKPEVNYLEAWALDWLENSDIPGSVSQQTFTKLLALALNRFPESRWLREEQRHQLERYADMALALPAEWQESPVLQMVIAGILRKSGRFDEALKIARKGVEATPGWHAFVAEGLALRERGDYDLAAESFQNALLFNPEDLSARLEAADGYLTHRAWDDALAWYGQVLEKDSAHVWALPSAYYCCWQATGDQAQHERLIELAKADPPNQRALQLLQCAKPYVDYLPAPADAIANVLRKVTKKFREQPPAEGDSFKITVSHLESPSATLAIHEQFRALGCELSVTIVVKQIAQPDPRVPCRPISQTLWKYNGTNAEPAMDKPSPSIVQLVTELASKPYDYERNCREAEQLANGLSAEQVPQLLATMIHPPAVPKGRDALQWLPRVQLAAAQIIAHIGSGWLDSARREGLFSALLGPRDWTTSAAIIALTQLARVDKNIAVDVREAFKVLADSIPDEGYCSFAHALFYNWELLPDLPAEEARWLREQIVKREQE
jgi:tetratricopeptide (TPR) repeat protein